MLFYTFVFLMLLAEIENCNKHVLPKCFQVSSTVNVQVDGRLCKNLNVCFQCKIIFIHEFFIYLPFHSENKLD
jgi:hypothetical protein